MQAPARDHGRRGAHTRASALIRALCLVCGLAVDAATATTAAFPVCKVLRARAECGPIARMFEWCVYDAVYGACFFVYFGLIN